MRKSLVWKLTLAFLLVAFLSAALVGGIARITSAARFSQFIVDQQRANMEAILAQYYKENGSWDGVEDYWGIIQRQAVLNESTPGEFSPGMGNRQQMGMNFRQGDRQLVGLADADGNVIVAVDPDYPPGSLLPRRILNAGEPIRVDGSRVGTLLLASQVNAYNAAEILYLQRTNRGFILAALAALLAALIVGVVLARTLTRPLGALTRASRQIAAGHYEQRVPVESSDEIGQLAESFNSMSAEVARVHEQRRQMTADIAHDLRTPLTVIAGYIESMRDGVLSPNPERLDLIYSEIERMQNLVGDLKMLSQVDAGELPLNLQNLSPVVLLERAAAVFENQAVQQKVRLTVDAMDPLPEIRVDDARMMQVLDNLISNAFRYTPEGGEIRLAASLVKGKIRMQVADTGSGIPAAELGHIFERFQRGDKSRHAEGGESGLGLAIVRALVEVQGGRVWAESSEGRGTTMWMEFPIVISAPDLKE